MAVDRGGYLDRTAQIESGGNPNARASTSSATGPFQFIDSTWRDLMRKRPDLGLTEDGRTNPEQSRRAADALTSDNERLLAANGIPITDGNRYLAHFLGGGGAVKLLGSAPTAPAVAVVGDAVAKANRSIFFNKDGSSKTVADIQNWAGRKYGGGGAEPAPAPPVEVASSYALPGAEADAGAVSRLYGDEQTDGRTDGERAVAKLQALYQLYFGQQQPSARGPLDSLYG